MADPFTVAESGPQLLVLRFAGQLNIPTATAIEARVLAAVKGVRSPIIMDIATVSFISSAAMGLLVRIAMDQALAGYSAVLVLQDGPVEHAIRSAKLDLVLRTAYTEALAREIAHLPPLAVPRVR